MGKPREGILVSDRKATLHYKLAGMRFRSGKHVARPRGRFHKNKRGEPADILSLAVLVGLIGLFLASSLKLDTTVGFLLGFTLVAVLFFLLRLEIILHLNPTVPSRKSDTYGKADC